jgi:hypothetical protein
MKKDLCFWGVAAVAVLIGIAEPARGQYDRAVVALTRLDYVYYNVDNPMSVSVPGLLPKDIVVSIGEDKAFLHRDPDGSNNNDMIVRPKDSTGTITVHVDERIDPQRTRNRGMVRYRVVTLPNPVLYMGYVRQGDTVALDDLINKGYIQVKAQFENLNLPLEEPVVLGYDLNRSGWFNVPIEVTGSRLSSEAHDMLSKARRDETLYIDNVRVLLPDGRTVTLKAEFPLK